jgi:hypothetical protein
LIDCFFSSVTVQKLDYRWFETSTIDTRGPATGVFWNLEGLRLLVSSGTQLQLYQHRMLLNYYSGKSTTSNASAAAQSTVSFSITDEDPDESHQNNNHSQNPQNPQNSWLPVWETNLSAPARYIKYSPDGAVFATCGNDDRLVKIWYQDSGNNFVAFLHRFRFIYFASFSDNDGRSDLSFSFTYLQHPAAVLGFEWRKTGRYMPRLV